MRVLYLWSFFHGADHIIGLIIACCTVRDLEKLRAITWLFRRRGQGARYDASKRKETACRCRNWSDGRR